MEALLLLTATILLLTPTLVPHSTVTNKDVALKVYYPYVALTAEALTLVMQRHCFICTLTVTALGLHTAWYDIQEVMCCSFVCCSCLWRGYVTPSKEMFGPVPSFARVCLACAQRMQVNRCFDAETG